MKTTLITLALCGLLAGCASPEALGISGPGTQTRETRRPLADDNGTIIVPGTPRAVEGNFGEPGLNYGTGGHFYGY